MLPVAFARVCGNHTVVACGGQLGAESDTVEVRCVERSEIFFLMMQEAWRDPHAAREQEHTAKPSQRPTFNAAVCHCGSGAVCVCVLVTLCVSGRGPMHFYDVAARVHRPGYTSPALTSLEARKNLFYCTVLPRDCVVRLWTLLQAT